LLRHLEQVGFRGAPRALGIDEGESEILTFIPGSVVHPRVLDTDGQPAPLSALLRVLRTLGGGRTHV
jgi:hypothetical protein